jgi:hypothetical protein
MPPEESEESSLWVDSADRKVAIRALAEHRAEEHLTEDEHGRRHGLVQQARTRGDLLALFADLPAPHPLIGEAPVGGAVRWYSTGPGLVLSTGSVIVLGALLAGWWVPAFLFAGLLVIVTVLMVVTRR